MLWINNSQGKAQAAPSDQTCEMNENGRKIGSAFCCVRATNVAAMHSATRFRNILAGLYQARGEDTEAGITAPATFETLTTAFGSGGAS